MSSKIVLIGCDGDDNLHLGFNSDFKKVIYRGDEEGEDFTTYEFADKSVMLTGGKAACKHELITKNLTDLLGELEPGQVVVCEIKPITTVDVKNPSELEYFETIPREKLVKL